MALYLAHLNPVTNAHVEIVSELLNSADSVKVMPVVFRDGDREVNSRSFPFSFEARREMLKSVFGDVISITDDYTFYAPFRRYMPPLLSPMSWKLRRQLLRGVDGDFFSYTGDRTEGYMLRLYRLRPHVGKRRPLSAASVKEKMYGATMTPVETRDDNDDAWHKDVPDSVASIIRREWDTVVQFADAPDMTTRIMGMKFPKETGGL